MEKMEKMMKIKKMMKMKKKKKKKMMMKKTLPSLRTELIFLHAMLLMKKYVTAILVLT